MNTHKIAVISCCGIIGYIIALVCGKKNSTTQHFFTQSLNSLISRWILIVLALLCIILMGVNTISILLSAIILVYNIYVVAITVTMANKLCTNRIFGIVEFFYSIKLIFHYYFTFYKNL